MAYRILIGGTIADPTYEFSDEIALCSIRQVLALDVVGTELAADVVDAEITISDPIIVPFGTPCRIMDGSTLISTMFVRQIVQIGKNQYQIETTSAVGLLEKRQHLGAIYTSKFVSDVLDELIGNAFTYTVTPAVASQIVRGLLPPDTCRANLHRLMFALGIALDKDSNGDPVFTFLDPNATPVTIPADRIFEAGGSVDFTAPATSVEVVEHSVYELPDQTEPEQLFDNRETAAADHQLVQFSAPFFDLRPSAGLTINASGPYYAILTGTGTLTGRAYIHNTQTVVAEASAPSGEENIIQSENDTLINSLNSENVAARLLAYYSSRKIVRRTVKLVSEKPGMLVTLADAFGSPVDGYIAESNVRIGAQIRKAELKIITGYVPTGQGNKFSTVERVTASGAWTVPSGVTQIRVVVIGGGNGGDGGHHGTAGRGGDKDYGGWQTYETTETRKIVGYAGSDGSEAGKGGAGGTGGVGGAVIVQDITVAPGDVFSVTIGAAGVGGAVADYDQDAGTGTSGNDTTISSVYGTVSSSNGQRIPTGYYDPINDEVYATDGPDGVDGGDGGKTTITSLNGFGGNSAAETAGFPGEDVGEWSGASGGIGLYDYSDDPTIRAGGQGGGGAAYGHNGWPGDAPYIEQHGAITAVIGSMGGMGASASAYPAAGYGCGGGGGNGGGGGGNGGGVDVNGNIGNYEVFCGEGGARGAGTAGVNGGSGCVLFYY